MFEVNSYLKNTLIFFILISFIIGDEALEVDTLYSQARQVRALDGHIAAQHLYQQILKLNPNDATAATRIAACVSSPQRHDQLGEVGSIQDKIEKDHEVDSGERGLDLALSESSWQLTPVPSHDEPNDEIFDL